MLAEFVSGLTVPNDTAAGWWRVLFAILGLLALIALTFWFLVH